MFKPNISPTIMDQSPHKVAHVITEPSGERVIVDPAESLNSVMLWFYLLINIGGAFGIQARRLLGRLSSSRHYLLSVAGPAVVAQ
jgi:cytochrome c-type biogenesis protein CcmH/NrfF